MLYLNSPNPLAIIPKAEQYYQRVLATRKQLLGLKHPDTALSLNNLAYLYSLQRRYAEAEVLYQQALSIREQVLGAEHPLVASTLNNLASLYQEQGKYEESERLYQRVLQILRQTLEPQHIAIAFALNNLAVLCVHHLGKYEEAEKFYREALQICESTLGLQHAYSRGIGGNYAFLLHTMGRETEALSLEALFNLPQSGEQESAPCGTTFSLFGLLVYSNLLF